MQEARWRLEKRIELSASEIKCKRARKMPRGRGGGLAERSELRGGGGCLSLRQSGKSCRGGHPRFVKAFCCVRPNVTQIDNVTPALSAPPSLHPAASPAPTPSAADSPRGGHLLRCKVRTHKRPSFLLSFPIFTLEPYIKDVRKM